MKEILFRGKNIKTGVWIEGFYGEETNEDSLNKDNFKPRYFICTDMSDEFVSNCFEVVFDTIGQYISMKDDSGKKIFEGDILKITTEEQVLNDFDPYSTRTYSSYRNEIKDGIYVVYFDEELCEYRFKLQYYETGSCYYRQPTYSKRISVHDYQIKEKFIIGNIFDNPDLLQENID